MPAVADGNADARADVALVLADAHRRLEAFDDALGQLLGADVVAAVEQQHEFVATAARRQRMLGHQPAQAVADLHQQLVADLVAEAVIDALEVVQVEVEQRQRQARREQLFGRCTR